MSKVSIYKTCQRNVKASRKTLHYAAETNNVTLIKQLLSQGADVDSKDGSGRIALHLAAIHNEDESHFEVAEVLLKNKADVNARNNENLTPLWYLLHKGNVKIVQLFLDFKADVRVTRNDDRTLLYPAVHSNNNPEVVHLLVNLGLDVNHRSNDGMTPLYDSWNNYKNKDSQLKIIEILLKNGGNINTLDNQGFAPLFALVQIASVEMLQLFLKHKADFSVLDSYGHNLLTRAVGYSTNVDAVQFLIDTGLDVNHRSKLGSTPLHWACGFLSLDDNIKIIKCLLKNSANIDAVDEKGYTPLFKAACGIDMGRLDSEEIMKKIFNFIMEHTDFNVIHHGVNILTFYYKPLPDYLWKMILQHVAKLKTLSTPVHSDLVDTISKQSNYSDYYKQCQEELVQAKNTKLLNSWVTFYNLLVDGRKKIKNYAGNRDLIADFKKSGCVKKYPIYGASMSENVKKGMKRRKLFDKSASALSDCLPIFGPSHLIINDVLNCVMSKKDLSKFCKKS